MQVGSDAAPDNGVAVERREAQPPPSMGARPPEAADPGNRTQPWARGGFRQTRQRAASTTALAPPGAPFPHAGRGKRDDGLPGAGKEYGRRSVSYSVVPAKAGTQ